MKYVKLIIKIFMFIIGVLISLWILMPWGRIGEYAVLSAERTASSKGFDAKHSSVSGSWKGPTIRINDFSAKMALGGGEFKTLTISPSFMQSIIRFSPVALVSFTGGKLSLPGGNDADMGSGKVEVSIKRGILLLKNFKSAGELSLDGSLAIDINGNKIDNADLIIRSPEKIEPVLRSISIMLPITQESAGQWRLRRDKND